MSSARALLARTTVPVTVSVAIPIAARSKSAWNCATCSSRTRCSSLTSLPPLALPTRLNRLSRVRGGGAAFQGTHQPVGELVERERLLDKVGCAELAGAIGKTRLLETGEHHHGGVRADGHDRRQRLEAVAGRHRGVEQQEVGLVPDHQADGLVAVAALTDHVEQAGLLQAVADQRAQLLGVVDQDDRKPRTAVRTCHHLPLPISAVSMRRLRTTSPCREERLAGYRRAMQVVSGAGRPTPTDGAAWVEHLRVPDLSCGTYSIAAGASGPAGAPHRGRAVRVHARASDALDTVGLDRRRAGDGRLRPRRRGASLRRRRGGPHGPRRLRSGRGEPSVASGGSREPGCGREQAAGGRE